RIRFRTGLSGRLRRRGPVNDGHRFQGAAAGSQQGGARGHHASSRKTPEFDIERWIDTTQKVSVWLKPVQHSQSPVLLEFHDITTPGLSGTKRTASCSLRTHLLALVRSMSTSFCTAPPSGAINLPPMANCSSKLRGISNPAAAMIMASKGAAEGTPNIPSPKTKRSCGRRKGRRFFRASSCKGDRKR